MIFTDSDEPLFRPFELTSDITTHAVAFAADDSNEIRASGSAVFVAPGLAVTAGHVLEDAWRSFQSSDPVPDGLPRNGNFRMHLLQFPANDLRPALWWVPRAWSASFTDIAFLECRPANPLALDFRWTSNLLLSLVPPSPGELVSGLGFPSSSAALGPKTTVQDIQWTLRPHGSVGRVLEVFPLRRDDSLLHFPSFSIDARFDGGMSGGPIFNEKGQLCGLVCACLDPAPGQRHISYGASLWPAMYLNVDFTTPGLSASAPYPIFDLIAGNFIHAVGWDTIRDSFEIGVDNNGQARAQARTPAKGA